jgi:hypothetical protein
MVYYSDGTSKKKRFISVHRVVNTDGNGWKVNELVDSKEI